MSDRITVRAGDRGLIWVFAVDLEQKDVPAFTRRNGDWPVRKALGAESLEPEHVEVFPVSDLEGLVLSGYLEEGMGVPPDQLDGLRERLDGQRGTVMVLSSKALDGSEQVLTPKEPLRLLASFSEERAAVNFAPLPSGSATGSVSGAKSADLRPGKRGWLGPLLLLLVLAVITLGAWVLS